MKTLQVKLEDFGISPCFGFLPDEPPVKRLSSLLYDPWESIIDRLPELIKNKRLNTKILKLPTLSTSQLASEGEWRRAYVILSFIIHAWVWHGNSPQGSIPPCLSEPYLSVCKLVRQEPVLSYSGLCLWNWKTKDGSHHPQSMKLDNLECMVTFTGSRDEEAFYLVPDMIEAEGGALPGVLLRAIDASQNNNSNLVSMALLQCAETLDRMGAVLGELNSQTCEPNFFYTKIRPYLSGSKGMEKKGLPQGFLFHHSNGEVTQAQNVGGNAGQSTLFPVIDKLLGVKHASPLFTEMQPYMYGEHRRFLRAVGELPSIRAYVQEQSQNKELQEAYDKCIESLKTWRTKHISLVTRYIVLPAKQVAKAGQELEEAAGTGGSAPVPFLKVARDETMTIGGGP